MSAHEVARRTGFTVSYATIRADDLPQYLDNGMVTTAAMRELTFTFYERLVLVPVELVVALKSKIPHPSLRRGRSRRPPPLTAITSSR